jgi:pilus assembly protein CpaE
MTLRDWWKEGPAGDAAREPEPARAAGPEVLMRQVITVVSPKGGVGKTFISVNLGAALARHTGFRVLLVDLDLRSGDAAVHLDLVGRPTLAELLPYAGELSEEHLDRAVVTHDPSGLEVLLAPVRPEAADMLTREHLEALVRVTRQRYDFVIIDTPPDPSDAAVVECLRETTAVLLVSSLDAAALRQCRLLLESSALGGRDLSRRLFIILNQAHGKAPLPASRAAAFLKADAGAGRVFEIPEDRPCVERAVFEGRPVVLTSPEHPVARGIYELAHTFCPVFAGLLGAGSRRPAGLRSLIEAIRRW